MEGHELALYDSEGAAFRIVTNCNLFAEPRYIPGMGWGIRNMRYPTYFTNSEIYPRLGDRKNPSNPRKGIVTFANWHSEKAAQQFIDSIKLTECTIRQLWEKCWTIIEDEEIGPMSFSRACELREIIMI